METVTKIFTIVTVLVIFFCLNGCALPMAELVAPYALTEAKNYVNKNPKTVSSIKDGTKEILGNIGDTAKKSFSWIKRQVSGEKNNSIEKKNSTWINPDTDLPHTESKRGDGTWVNVDRRISPIILPRKTKKRIAPPGVKIIEDNYKNQKRGVYI